MSKDKPEEEFGGPFFQAFRDFGKTLKLPTVTVEDIVAHHKKNIKALEQAAGNTTASTQAIMAQQRKALEEALADITHMVQDARDGGFNKENARDIIADQMEFTKRSFETTIRNATEIGEIAQKTGKDNLAILRTRVQESLAEMRDMIDRTDKNG